jgi:Protein of unknown function (DUF1598)
MIVGHRWNQLRAFYRTLAVTAAFLGCAFASANANAQFLLNRLGVVGGVKIDADGVVQAATQEDRAGILRELREKIVSPAGKIASSTKLRMVSLAKLQKEIERALAAKEELSDEVRYMAGLQRIEYVFVYPETNDIVLAGPAEGWQVRDDATVVGVTTGRPVLQLEDLLVALRTVKDSQQQAITVSIDPTPAGEKRLQQLLSSLRTGPGFDPSQYEAKMKEAFGPQQVTLTTVANTSRMARTLVAADYRMKTLAMNLESSPVAGLPSYMEMIRNNGAPGGTQPRWWMACEYDALLKSEDGLAWQLTGQGVKALTEEEFVEANGARKAAGRKNKLAQKWADQFTAKFDELCAFNSAFGDLRNVMDLNVVATVIEANNLEQVAGIDLGLLKSGSKLETPAWESPKTIPAHCSFVSGRAGWTVSASGGVEINPWRVVAQQTKTNDAVALVRTKASKAGDSWWW